MGSESSKLRAPPQNQARVGYPGVKKQTFVVVPMRALTLNCRDHPLSVPCLSPGLLTYQPPLSPAPQALSEPPSAGTGSSEETCWGDAGSSRSLLHLFISLFTALSVRVLFAPYQAINPAQRRLVDPASSGLSWSCTRRVKLLVKPIRV